MANVFRYECMSIIKKGRDKKENNITEKICSGVRRWLKQNNLLLMENNKGRATCIIAKEKRDELVANEMHNVERYSKLKKDDIDKVRAAINKRLKEMARYKVLTIEEEKELRQKTPVTPSARSTLKSHKDPLKVRLIINTQGSAFYKRAKFVAKNVKQLTTSGKSFIKDSEQFINKLKDIFLQFRQIF